MELYEKDGIIMPRNRITLPAPGGGTVYNPTPSQLLAAGWKPYEPPTPEPPAPSYPERVEALIRERYSVSDEIALLRQREAKADEFTAYYAYCEACKERARQQGEA